VNSPAPAARWSVVVAGVWAGVLLGIGALAAPSAFAALAPAEAGRMLARVFEQEAWLSLGLAAGLFVVERRRARLLAASGAGSVLSAEVLLLLGVLFCTVAGYFALQPMLAAARAGQGAWSFGALHGVSSALFALKGLLVLVLAWRWAAR
jgi:hypothetical protein